MKYTILLWLLFPVFSYSQSIKAPTWSQTAMYFETAKIKTYNEKTKKYGPETFKTCKISFGDEDLASAFAIDIPDKFYLKDGEVYSVSYNLDNDGSTRITYTLTKEKSMCGVTFYFSTIASERPDQILVTVLDNYKMDKPSKRSYLLMELK